jgi:hypothetical protein
MTDRHAGYVVTLRDDIREDDAESTITALRMIQGVIGVEPIIDSDGKVQLAQMRADSEWRRRVIALLEQARK